MHKIFLAVSSMIVTGFLMKSYKKLHEKPDTEDEVYRRMREAYEHLKIESRRADARKTFNRMAAIFTQRNAGPTSLIDSLAQMAHGRFA